MTWIASVASRDGVVVFERIRGGTDVVFKTERELKELREERPRTGSTLELDEILKRRRENSDPVLAVFKRWVE